MVAFRPRSRPADRRSAGLTERTAGTGFHTAAEVWRSYRSGVLDIDTFGVDPSVPMARGAWMVRNYVVLEVAHRFGDELLLWDHWGTMKGPGSGDQDTDLIDEVAALLVAADSEDAAAERRLLDLYRTDVRLHPGDTVLRVDLPDQELVPDSLTGSPASPQPPLV